MTYVAADTGIQQTVTGIHSEIYGRVEEDSTKNHKVVEFGTDETNNPVVVPANKQQNMQTNKNYILTFTKASKQPKMHCFNYTLQRALQNVIKTLCK